MLLPYAMEALHQLLHHIARVMSVNQPTASRATYLIEKLSTHRKKYPKRVMEANHDLRLDLKKQVVKNLNDLYNELAQHQDWQKAVRLILVRALESL
ncbi:primosomal replication protein [Vibrio lentus]|nr:primosomal replication protein [Vibrio lentus]